MSPTVSNAITRWMLDTLSEAGVSRPILLGMCNLSEYEVDKKNGRIAAEQHYQLMLASAEYADILYQNTSPDIFYHLFPDYISACLNQVSAYAAVQTYINYRHIKGSYDNLQCERQDNALLIEYRNQGPQALVNSSAIGNFILLASVLRQYLPAMSLRVGFTGHSPMPVKEINARLGVNCQFEQSRNTLLVESDYLDEPLGVFNDRLHGLQMSQLYKLSAEVNRQRDFSSLVRDLVETKIGAGYVDSSNNIMDNVCANLKLSRWTLNRKLSADGTSFTEILKKVRLNSACRLLAESNKSIQEISDLTCFGSLASFSRFFSGETNISPVQYRRRSKAHV